MDETTEFPVTYYRGRPHNHPQGTLLAAGEGCPACDRFWMHHLVANNPPETLGPVPALIIASVLVGLVLLVVQIVRWIA